MREIHLPNGRAREMEEDDIPALLDISRDPSIQKYYFITSPESMEDYWAKRLECQKWDREHERLAVRTTYDLSIEHNGDIVGLFTFQVEPYRFCSAEGCPNKHLFELSYFIGRNFRRQGIAEATVRASIPLAFEELDAGGIGAVCLVENTASQSLLQKVGLLKKWEGISKRSKSKGRYVTMYGVSYKDASSSLN